MDKGTRFKASGHTNDEQKTSWSLIPDKGGPYVYDPDHEFQAQPPTSDPPSSPGHKLDPMKVIKVIISRPGLYAVLEETFASGRIFHSTDRSLESELKRLKNYVDSISVVSEAPS